MSSTVFVSFRACLPEYKKQAEALLEEFKSGEHSAVARVKWTHPLMRDRSLEEVRSAVLDVVDIQEALANEYGFQSWAALEEFTRAIQFDRSITGFESAVEAIVTGDLATLKALLNHNPELVHQRSTRKHHATLLFYVAANGVESCRQKTPKNAVEIATTLLEAGADVHALADVYDTKCATLSMLASSCHPANAGLQVALAEKLLDHGAGIMEPGSQGQSSIVTALAFGYLDTARAIARRTSPADNLAEAAGLGRITDVIRLLPLADAERKQIALALAAQHGHHEIAGLLIDAGEDPNRFNPKGFHAHSTPLHQAAWGGHGDAVRLLVERGARLNSRDKNHQSTPLGWAIHAGHTEIADYLKSMHVE